MLCGYTTIATCGLLAASGAKFSTQKADELLEHNHRVSLEESVVQTKQYVDFHGIIPSKKLYDI